MGINPMLELDWTTKNYPIPDDAMTALSDKDDEIRSLRLENEDLKEEMEDLQREVTDIQRGLKKMENLQMVIKMTSDMSRTLANVSDVIVDQIEMALRQFTELEEEMISLTEQEENK